MDPNSGNGSGESSHSTRNTKRARRPDADFKISSVCRQCRRQELQEERERERERERESRPTPIFLFQEGRACGRSIHEFEKLVKADPEDRVIRTRLVTAYRSANRTPDAEKMLNDVLKKNPKSLDALLQRGEISLAAGNYGPAERDFNQVVSLDPKSAEVHYALAQLYLAQGATARNTGRSFPMPWKSIRTQCRFASHSARGS